MFPGVDGGLPYDYLTACCSKAIFTKPIDRALWNNYLSRLYDLIKDRRPGNTIPNMLKILDDSLESNITINKYWHVNGSRPFCVNSDANAFCQWMTKNLF